MPGPTTDRIRTKRHGALLHIVLAAPERDNSIDLDFTARLATRLATAYAAIGLTWTTDGHGNDVTRV